ncbi:MAG: T9SS type A sorting domain-containing protein [bacterium]
MELFTLGPHNGAICLYPLGYFKGSGFEPDDRLCWENYCLEAEGITNYGAKRVQGIPQNGTNPRSGDWMYKIYGQDVSNGISFIRFKVFPYNILIKDSAYFSFWIYVEDTPGDSAPIGIDCLLKSGKRLSEWTKYGKILDQYGRELNPACRRVPAGAWYQYVFTFNPAVNETIDHIEIVYDGLQFSETGSFVAYIDDIKILTQFPIPICWYCERFPTDPTYGDPNFLMNFIAQGDSVRLIINPQGDSGGGGHWVGPTPGIRNNITDIPVDSPTAVIWSQYDRAHSLILGLLVKDNQAQKRWLYYAKNASNHWHNQGWVNMGDTTRRYNTWEGFFRNIRNDYIAEYGANVEPESIIELRVQHFAWSQWDGDSGGTMRNLSIVPFASEFTLNQNQVYTNLPFVVLRTKAITPVTADSMKIWQYYIPQQETLRYCYSTGWIGYDTTYCWYLREGEGNNIVYIQYKIGGYSESPVYCDTIVYDKIAPGGSFVINDDNKFTNNPNVVIKNSMSDTRSNMAKMRYGNQYLKNLVINSAFDDTSCWIMDTAIYHDSLQLFEIPVQTAGNYFYQSIPPESLSVFDNDTLLLWIDLVSDNFVGNGKVQFQYIYGIPTDSINPKGTHPYGTSITILQGTKAHNAHYNLYSYFKYHPEPPPGKVLLEARVGVFVDAGAQNSGRLFIDNFRLDVVSPYNNYSKFENYDTLKSWTLTSGNGIKKVYGQFSDGSGNETDILFDSIIVDTTKPARRIASPQNGQTISGTVTITGWAYDPADPQQHFKVYELKYMKNADPAQNWYGIHPESLFYIPKNPTIPPQNLGRWDTREVTNNHGNGWYYLRLAVKDSANNYQDTIICVRINNNPIDLAGEVSGFSNYLYGLSAGSDIYVGEIGTGKVYRYDNSYQLLGTFNLIDSLGIGFPVAMRFDKAGKLWIANIVSQTLNRFSAQGNFEFRFGASFSLPSGIAFDNSDHIWVSDRLHHKIKKLDSSGNLLFEFGTKGSGYGEIDRPIGIALYGGKIYIADSKNNRISVFDTLGNFVCVIGDSIGLSMPFGLVMDSTGCLFVSDFLGNQVIEFDPYGNPLLMIDSILDSPSGLALSGDEKTLYVSDTKHKRVLGFAVRGEPPDSAGGGPMGGEIQITEPFFLERVSPNPAKGILRIKFNSPDNHSITIKLYDVCGRLVHKENIIKSKIGMNEILIRPEGLSAGVYFVRLEIEGYEKIEKAILLK